MIKMIPICMDGSCSYIQFIYHVGPFNIPPYDPSKSCSEIATSTTTSSASTHTFSPTSSEKITRTTPTPSVPAYTLSPASAGSPNNGNKSNFDVIMAVVLALVLAVCVTVLILLPNICRKLVHSYMQICRASGVARGRPGQACTHSHFMPFLSS